VRRVRVAGRETENAAQTQTVHLSAVCGLRRVFRFAQGRLRRPARRTHVSALSTLSAREFFCGSLSVPPCLCASVLCASFYR